MPFAEQLAVVPPPDPAQDQVHGQDPETALGVPAEQRFDDGAVLTVVPFAVPHAPFTAATQEDPFHVYPPLQELAVFDSPPLVATAPFVQEKVCWYVRVPFAMATTLVGLVVVAWLNAGTL